MTKKKPKKKTFKRYLYVGGKLADKKGFDVDGMAYACGGCDARGVKLWRPYQTSDVELRCGRCVCTEQSKPYEIDSEGRFNDDTLGRKTDSLGWWVPAVPDERPDADGDVPGIFWGYTSVPESEVAWWRALPNEAPEPEQCGDCGEVILGSHGHCPAADSSSEGES